MSRAHLRIGLIGMGNQTKENLLPALLQCRDVEVATVHDLDPSAAASIRNWVRTATVAPTLQSLLHDNRIDAVIAACPPQAHYEIARQAMAAGIPVFVEKPPCVSLEELEELCEIARLTSAITAVGMNFRFSHPLRQLRNSILQPEFGRTLHIQINHYASKPRSSLWAIESTVRSFFLAQAIHSVDLAVSIAAAPIVSISPRIHRGREGELYTVNLTFENGAAATVLTGSIFPYFEFDMRVVGDGAAMASLDQLWNLTLHKSSAATPGTKDKRWREAWQPSPLDSGYSRSGYIGEVEEFFNSVREGKRPSTSFDTLVPTYQVIEALCAEERRAGFGITAVPLSLPSSTVWTLPQ
jgi:predicted dehydrogenase